VTSIINYLHMKHSEIKRMIISSLDNEADSLTTSSEIQEALALDFSDGFEDKVLGRLNDEMYVVKSDSEFNRKLSLAFYRVTFTAAAAIVLLMLSIFLKEGSLTFDSLLGVSDGYSESIVCLLTGN